MLYKVFVNGHPITEGRRGRLAALQNLGNCPQVLTIIIVIVIAKKLITKIIEILIIIMISI